MSARTQVKSRGEDLADADAERIVLAAKISGTLNGEVPPLNLFFYPAHKIIYAALAELESRSIPTDIVTLTRLLAETGDLEKAGGAIAITQLGDEFAGKQAELVEFELGKLRDLHAKREQRRIAEHMLRGDITPEQAQEQLAALNRADDLPTPCSIIALARTNPAIFEADNLLGIRFLCVEGGMLFVGPSGIGKSSANVQQDILWALGRPAFGIRPTRPLRILCVQAENDDGDLAEMACGVCDHLNLSDEERALVDEHVIYIKEKALTGEDFIRQLRRLVRKYRPDIIRIDPLHAYAGGDVCDPMITTPFLRNGLNPILEEFRCAAIVCHHTPKTTYRDTSKWNATDWAYAGAGNADVTNWARAILVIDATRVHGAFVFRAAKRGSRVGWADDDGHRVYDRLFCHHAGDAIFWRDATDEDMERVALAKAKRGEPPKTKEDLKALVPLDEEIPKLALIQRANMNGFGLNHTKRLLATLIADKDLFESRKPRKGTCPEAFISRREQTLIP